MATCNLFVKQMTNKETFWFYSIIPESLQFSPANQKALELCVRDCVCIDYLSFFSIFSCKNCYFPLFCSIVKNVNFYGPQSEYIVSGSDCSHIFLWDKQSEEVVQFLQGDNAGAVSSIVRRMFDPRSFFSTTWGWWERLERVFEPWPLQCQYSAVPVYQLSCLAIWQLVVIWVDDKPHEVRVGILVQA